MMFSLLVIGVIISPVASQIGDETCLLQARSDVSGRSSNLNIEPASSPWSDGKACRAWAKNKQGKDYPIDCISALLRTSVLHKLGQAHPDWNITSEEPIPASGLKLKKESGKMDMLKVKPKLCTDMDQRNCRIDIVGDDKFHDVRQLKMPGSSHKTADEDLKVSLESGPLHSLTSDSGGGKSGATFMQTFDGHFVFKAGVLNGMTMDEVANIKILFEGGDGKQKLLDYFRAEPNSLLDRIYGLLHVQLGDSILSSDEAIYVILEDATHRQAKEMKALGNEVGYTQYDLKSRPNVDHEHFINSQGHTMYLKPTQCDRILAQLRKDASFLASYGMIDFSLFVGVAESSVDAVEECPKKLGPPFCQNNARPSDGTQVQYTLSIIDFLNDKNWFKTMENWIPWKYGKFDNWGDKIVDLAAKICIPSAK